MIINNGPKDKLTSLPFLDNPYHPDYLPGSDQITWTEGGTFIGCNNNYNVEKVSNGYVLEYQNIKYIFANKEELMKQISELIT